MEYGKQLQSPERCLRVVAIIQARLTSTRLPRKILRKIGDKAILHHVIDNVRKAKTVDDIVLASPHDIPLKLDVPVFLGEENDVLKRFYRCSQAYPGDIFVRITADCPFIDPDWIDFCVDVLKSGGYEYVTNRPYAPDGLDVEVFTAKALESAYKNARSKYEKEHVTPWMRDNLLKVGILDGSLDYRHIKLSVDTEADLKRVRRIYGLQR